MKEALAEKASLAARDVRKEPVSTEQRIVMLVGIRKPMVEERLEAPL